MFAITFRRMLGLFLLGLVLTTPAFAEGFRASATAGTPDALGRFWSFLTSLWSPAGCYIDPDGWCSTSPSTAPVQTDQMDTGCMVDPSGHCGA
jgi:hypothetical protein